MLFVYDATTGAVTDITGLVLTGTAITVIAAVLIWDHAAVRTRKVGGIRFTRIGRVFLSFGLSRAT